MNSSWSPSSSPSPSSDRRRCRRRRPSSSTSLSSSSSLLSSSLSSSCLSSCRRRACRHHSPRRHIAHAGRHPEGSAESQSGNIADECLLQCLGLESSLVVMGGHERGKRLRGQERLREIHRAPYDAQERLRGQERLGKSPFQCWACERLKRLGKIRREAKRLREAERGTNL